LRFCLLEFFVDVKIVPKYDSVLNETFTVGANLQRDFFPYPF